MMDFSAHAGQVSTTDILPKGLLVYAVLTVQGVKTSATPSRYVEVELTVNQGQPFAGRKLWDKIGDPFFSGNSEKYRQMGQVAITRILEAGRGASPNNPAGYKIDDYSQLNGLKVAVKVGIEEGTDGHADKNRVAEWLTPNPDSQSGYKGYKKLTEGDHGIGQPAAGSQTNGFGASAGNGQQTTGGFGMGGGAQSQPATTGFGTTGAGFQKPPADGSGQTGANGATTVEGQSQQTGATASRSDPGATPGWLQQTGGAQAQG